MNVLLLSRYGRMGASSRVRVYQYLKYFETHGCNVTVSPLLTDNYIRHLYAGKGKSTSVVVNAYLRRVRDLLHCRKYDLIWLEKEVFPWLPLWAERWLSRLNIPYVVDYDDAIFHNYDEHSRLLVRKLLGTKIDEVMRRAALVIVGNDYLRARALQAGATRVELVPTVVDLEHYCVASHVAEGEFTIGWIGTPVTARYLHTIEAALSEVCSQSAARVILIGSGPIDLGDVPLEIRPWSEDTEAADINAFDVGIMPLPDAPWERGK